MKPRRRLLSRPTTVYAVASILLVGATVAACGGDDGGVGAPAAKETPTSSAPPSSQTTTTTSAPPSTTASTTTTTSASSTTTTGQRVSTPTTAPTVAGPGQTLLEASFVKEKGPDSYWRFEKRTANAVAYNNALVLSGCCNHTRYIEIDAGRSRNRFVADLAIPDDQRSSDAFHVEVALDGQPPVYVADVRFGETKPIDIPVPNVLRVRVSWSATNGSSSNTYQLALGNPRFMS
jgi:hypothetical protein